jgi:hypothetical protein
VKLFTPRKANETLPLVRKIVSDILETGRQMRALAEKIGAGAEENPEVVRLMDQLEVLFDELETIGCSYRDWNFSMGLVDFPAKIGGREVLLCWRSDEPSLQYYHEADAGFAGRKPIPQTELSQ